MRARGKTFLVSCSLLALPACDKVYFARIDVGPHVATQVSVAPLSVAEHDRAVAAFQSAAVELGLHCESSKYSIITRSYDSPPYQLTACRAKDQYTQIQLADSPSHVAVEVHQIGGISEPPFFHECRVRFGDRMRAALPEKRVTIRYPYHWSSRRASPQ